MPKRSSSDAYAAALARIYAMQSRGIRLGVTRTAEALALRGHPERGQIYVQVAGTNGKGSVSSMIAACLTRAGYRTGLFTSPHLHRYVERVRIGGRPLSEREATRRILDLLAAFERDGAPETTFFELTTLLALEAFRDHRCDIAVLEVGLGGRLDATTAVTPTVCVITGIAFDHKNLLGDTLAQIAREKAGILKPGVPAVIGVRERSARAVIVRRLRSVGAQGLLVGRDFELLPHQRPDRFAVRVGTDVVSDLRLSLPGDHQRHNAACAVAALVQLRAAGFDLPDAVLRKGLAQTRWPARLECVAGKPGFLFDAAHNPEGCHALAAFLESERRRGGPPPVLVFGAMADKEYAEMLGLLAPHAARVFFASPPIPRAATPADLRRHYRRGVATRNVREALREAKRAAGAKGRVVVAGSIFLVAEARAVVLGLPSDPLIRM